MIEPLLLILLLGFALLAVLQRHLRVAVIFLGVFSLLCSILYLFLHAPDVAMAEAAIGSIIATLLYLVTLRKQEWIRDIGDVLLEAGRRPGHTAVLRHRVIAGVMVTLLLAGVLLLYERTGLSAEPARTVVADAYRSGFFSDTGSRNAVTAIYLDYRIYDTLFETLMLLVSVMGVVFFSRFQLQAESGILAGTPVYGHVVPHPDQQLTARVIGLLHPFIILVGFYLILNGHVTPGGGFQGGAVLSAVLVLRYLSLPLNDIRIQVLQTAEKVLFLLILLVPVLYLFTPLYGVWPALRVPYLILLNSLIGLKVGCGISVVCYRFVFFESR